MSGFDDNPFGEPTVDNPFADPAIQQATRTTTNVQNSLEDYNPFEQEQSKPQLQINSTNNAAVVQPLSQNIPSNQQRVATTATPSVSVQITTEELQRRQEELDRKAAELDRREQQLQGNIPQLNNWPPLPDNFCVKPCFYQDFNLEIPPEFQRLVKHLYYTWMFYTLTMCVNIIGGLIILFHRNEFTNFGLAIFYTLLFTPASYICWFRPAYKAFRNDSSFNFMVFFFVYFFQTIFSVFQAVGFPGTGYCGFIVAITQFDSSASGIIVGLLLLCIAFCFAVTAAANIMMITKKTVLCEAGVRLTIEFKTLPPGRRPAVKKTILSEAGVRLTTELQTLPPGRRPSIKKTILCEAGVRLTIELKTLPPGRRPTVKKTILCEAQKSGIQTS